jgi:hypothetical protein
MILYLMIFAFQAQIHLIGELHSQINYAAKGVDINDPLLPISMPRGYGGVAADLFFLMYEFGGSVHVEWDMQRKRPCVRVVVDDFQRCFSVPERV